MQIKRAALSALMPCVSSVAVQAEMAAPSTPPEAPKFDARGEPTFVNRADIYDYMALGAEPLVYKTANMVGRRSL